MEKYCRIILILTICCGLPVFSSEFGSSEKELVLTKEGTKTECSVKKGDKVKFHYVGTLEDGSKFDSSRERGCPLEFEAGTGRLGDVVFGMKLGERKTIKIMAEDAYGEKLEELIVKFDLSQFPEGKTPSLGDKIQILLCGGRLVRLATVVGIEGETITLDANHDLAGKNLIFEVELIEIA